MSRLGYEASSSSCHRGDLRGTRLLAANDLIREGGADAISIRKLAE